MLPGNTENLFENIVSQIIESRVVFMFFVQEDLVGVPAKGIPLLY